MGMAPEFLDISVLPSIIDVQLIEIIAAESFSKYIEGMSSK
jgi:hypothetical protein